MESLILLIVYNRQIIFQKKNLENGFLIKELLFKELIIQPENIRVRMKMGQLKVRCMREMLILSCGIIPLSTI